MESIPLMAEKEITALRKKKCIYFTIFLKLEPIFEYFILESVSHSIGSLQFTKMTHNYIPI